MSKLRMRLAESIMQDYGVSIVDKTEKLIMDIISEIGSKAAKEIGYTNYDEGVDTIIIMNVKSKITLSPSTTLQQISDAIEEAIEEWQKDTQENHM